MNKIIRYTKMNLADAEMVESTENIHIDKKTNRKVPCRHVGSYILLREIGRGAFAKVFKGKYA